MTTTYTFVNATAARLFAEWWNKACEWSRKNKARKVRVSGQAASFDGGDNVWFIHTFQNCAEAFNAASQKAREIAEGDSNDN